MLFYLPVLVWELPSVCFYGLLCHMYFKVSLTTVAKGIMIYLPLPTKKHCTFLSKLTPIHPQQS